MPTYTYECNECKERFEAIQKMSEDHLEYCAICNAHNIKRVIVSASKPVLKGNGWTGSSLTKR